MTVRPTGHHFRYRLRVCRWIRSRQLRPAVGGGQRSIRTRVYELRTYTSPEGRLGDLQARFRNHTVKLFEKHGITSIGYFVPQDAPQSQNTLIYVLAHKDRESAKQNWAAFQKDPDWQAAFKESQKNGPLQTQVQSVFMDPLDFSQLK